MRFALAQRFLSVPQQNRLVFRFVVQFSSVGAGFPGRAQLLSASAPEEPGFRFFRCELGNVVAMFVSDEWAGGLTMSGTWMDRIIQPRRRLMLNGLKDRTAPRSGSMRLSRRRKAEPGRLC